MCGIAGAFAPAGERLDGLVEATGRMVRALAHRGPDHEGLWADAGAGVSLGYRRLAIVDLTADGQQPMRSADGRFVLVFNGEIYNHPGLRDELAQAGAGFRGRSDTEVLLAGIQNWGFQATLDKAAGMFGLAVWDARDRCLRLARDRAGKKPIYYIAGPRAFHFASEIKAFKAAGLELSTDTNALWHYLSLGYIPSPRTAYREVRELPAGCCLTIGQDLEPRIDRYWWLAPPSDGVAPRGEVIEEVETRLTLAVAQRLRADVPVGVFLSGGIDSGLVTALAARSSGRPVRTFTVTFDDGPFDEGPLASQVVERYATEHQAIRLAPDVEALLPRVAAAYDEPFADPSALPTYAVAEAAGRELKVVLNGEGADEIFAGYRRHLAVWHAARWERWIPLPGGLLRTVAWRLPRPSGFRTPYALLSRAARGAGLPPAERYLAWSSDGFTEEEKALILRRSVARAPSTAATLDRETSWLGERGPVGGFMALDFVVSLGDCLLVKMDIATMAHSLEARSPFLDHRLVDYVAALPRRALFDGRTTKPLLRALAARRLPPDIVDAPKRGFEIPLVAWVSGPLRPMIADLCLSRDGVMGDLFDRGQVEALLTRRPPFRLDDERWAKRLWTLLMLALWDRMCRRAPVTAEAWVSAGS